MLCLAEKCMFLISFLISACDCALHLFCHILGERGLSDVIKLICAVSATDFKEMDLYRLSDDAIGGALSTLHWLHTLSFLTLPIAKLVTFECSWWTCVSIFMISLFLFALMRRGGGTARKTAYPRIQFHVLSDLQGWIFVSESIILFFCTFELLQIPERTLRATAMLANADLSRRQFWQTGYKPLIKVLKNHDRNKVKGHHRKIRFRKHGERV